ncbi:MAG: hypothetical protein NDI77_09460 [Geobacteraceae bacterium]|nr:hypothetical protein [Geobacteraceae bacterium]
MNPHSKRTYSQQSVVQTLRIIAVLLDTQADVSLDNLGKRIGATKNKGVAVTKKVSARIF